MKNRFLSMALLCLIPLSLYSMDVEFPLVQAMTHFPFPTSRSPGTGGREFFLELNHSNIYSYDSARFNVNDMGIFGVTVGFRYGLGPNLTLEAAQRVSFITPGVLDPVIVGFHDLFGLKQGGRGEYPENQVLYRLGEAFKYTGSRAALLPLVVGVCARVWHRPGAEATLRLAAGIPLDPLPGFSSDRPFVTAGLTLAFSGGDWRFKLNPRISFFRSPSWAEGIPMRERIAALELGVHYRRWSLDMLLRSSPFEETELANRAWVIRLGFRLLPWLELAIIEEFPPMDTTADVTFSWRVILPVRR